MNENSNQLIRLPVDASGGPAGDGTVRVDLPPSAGLDSSSYPGMPTDLSGVLRLLHRSLRGRYLLVIILTFAAGTLGGYAGWKLGRPVFRSEALLRIAYTLPEVMQETDQNKPLAQYDAFMSSQRLLITSRKVIDRAMQDPVWKSTGRQLPEKPDRYFAEHLSVEIKPRSEFIVVQVWDEDAGLAAAAVNAVINAYDFEYKGQEGLLARQRTGVLEDRQKSVSERIKDLDDTLNDGAEEYGTTKLDQFFEAAAARVMKLEAARADVRVAIATGSPSGTSPSSQPAREAPAAATQAAEFTPETIASRDPEMRRRLDQLSRCKEEVDRLAALGLGTSHKSMRAAQIAMDQAALRISEYVQEYTEFQAITGRNLHESGTAAVAVAGKSLEDLRADEHRLTQLLEQATQEMKSLGAKRLKLQQTESELLTLREELARLTKRSEVLEAEGYLGSRLTLVGSGDVPLSPIRDPRLKFALAGALAAACMPLGVFVAIGFLRRRYQYSDETEADIAPVVPLLGILPELDDHDDAERRSAAARCVHHVRMLLGARATRPKSSSYLVTSATAGEGKTSLTMSLGLSFAASGLRTLIIDCDLVGRRLTTALDAGKAPGLCESLERGTMGKCVRRTGEDLYFLPAGLAERSRASTLPKARMAALIAEARRYFEVVLVDSGPILGSLEASVVAPQVDGAILVISRGQERGVVRNAIQRLRSLGATPAGFVYNRADARDFSSSPYGSSSYSFDSASSSVQPQPAPKRLRPRLDDFGLLVTAVGSGLGNET